MAKYEDKLDKTIKYFNSIESRGGYKLLLKGTKHFGFYPPGKENISMAEAQRLMEDKLAKKLDLPANSVILDAGSGEGNVALNIAGKYGLRIYGVDLLDFAVKRSIEKSKRLNLENKLQFQVGDYTKLSFPNETFDGVYTMETLVHVPDYKKALSEFYRVLKPKGKLVLFEYSTFPREKLPQKFGQKWDLVVEESGMNSMWYFTHGRFPKILKDAGFENIKVENITPRVMPMLKKFYSIAYIPYIFIKLLRLQRKFVNATSSVEGYKNFRNSDYWRYNIITAVKSKQINSELV